MQQRRSKPTMELEEIEQLRNFLITQGAETIAATELQNEVSQAVACLIIKVNYSHNMKKNNVFISVRL
jgi:hypothetical protein